MRYFIHTVIDDFWTALSNDRIIESNLKPHPYKEYRELTTEERTVYDCQEHLGILFYSARTENAAEKKRQSMVNMVAETFPDLAEKHGLVIDRTHEYWRKK